MLCVCCVVCVWGDAALRAMPALDIVFAAVHAFANTQTPPPHMHTLAGVPGPHRVLLLLAVACVCVW